MIEDKMLVRKDLHAPRTCIQCGKAEPEYKGVGEYRCSGCGYLMYDDYGIVRNYLEVHKGATQSQVSRATGVSMDTIRYLLREERLEIMPTSVIKLECEMCGAPITSGRYCAKCEKLVKQKSEEDRKASRRSESGVSGYGKGMVGESGARRFIR